MSSTQKAAKRAPAKRVKIAESSATEPQNNLTSASNIRVSPQPKGPSRKELFRTVVTVRVGPEDGTHEEFVVHTELLCHHSPYFKAASSGSWIEAQTGIINLGDDSPAVFEVFQDWLYGNRLSLADTQASDTRFVMQLYIFGDKVHCAPFSTAALTILEKQIGRSGNLFDLPDVQYAFTNTAEISPLRELIVAFYVGQPFLVELVDELLEEEYPRAFVAAVMKGAIQGVQKTKTKTLKTGSATGVSGRNTMAPLIARLSERNDGLATLVASIEYYAQLVARCRLPCLG